eukprot:4738517-Pleurochrysis_carterae.AAC.1
MAHLELPASAPPAVLVCKKEVRAKRQSGMQRRRQRKRSGNDGTSVATSVSYQARRPSLNEIGERLSANALAFTVGVGAVSVVAILIVRIIASIVALQERCLQSRV